MSANGGGKSLIHMFWENITYGTQNGTQTQISEAEYAKINFWMLENDQNSIHSKSIGNVRMMLKNGAKHF